MDSDPRVVPRSTERVDLDISVPGSKSISCRALVLASMADGQSTLAGLLRADDTDALAGAMLAVGCGVNASADGTTIAGPVPGDVDATIDLGHGGTPARFMMAVASRGSATVTVDGSDRLRERPMADMVPMLEALGATVEALASPGHLPMRIRGGPWATDQLEVGRTASSQFLSALLLVAASMPSGLELCLTEAPTSAPYLRLTIAELRRWGVDVQTSYGDGYAVRIRVPGGGVQPQHRAIPADASSALFWSTAAAILPESCIRLKGVTLDDGQPDAAAFQILREMGLRLDVIDGGLQCRGPAVLRSAGLVNCDAMPDAAPALAVAACFADAPTRLTGLSTLRVKESDRVATIAGELSRAGCDVETSGDDLIVVPRPLSAEPVTLETWDDHRIAMAGAILGLRRGGVAIADPDCTAKSYPGFWGELDRFGAAAASGDTA